MRTDTTNRSRALVTGASSGIGAAFAEQLAKDGCDLVIVARSRDKLDALAEQLRSKHHANVEVITADLSKTNDLQGVEIRITEDTALDMLINNAGFGGYIPFVELNPD